jgi:hypothetical protein
VSERHQMGQPAPYIRMVESAPATDLRQAPAHHIMVLFSNPRFQPSAAKAHPIVWAKPGRTADAARPLVKLPQRRGRNRVIEERANRGDTERHRLTGREPERNRVTTGREIRSDRVKMGRETDRNRLNELATKTGHRETQDSVDDRSGCSRHEGGRKHHRGAANPVRFTSFRSRRQRSQSSRHGACTIILWLAIKSSSWTRSRWKSWQSSKSELTEWLRGAGIILGLLGRHRPVTPGQIAVALITSLHS